MTFLIFYIIYAPTIIGVALFFGFFDFDIGEEE